MNPAVIESSRTFTSFAVESGGDVRGQSSAPFVLAIVLTTTLLVLVLGIAWRVPMMLWEHLDLIPLYAAMLDGTLASPDP